MAELIPGRLMWCKIRAPQLNGFSVDIVGRDGEAFLSSRSIHSVGDEVLGTFVCFDKKGRRFLLFDQLSRFMRRKLDDTAGGDSDE